ncbi:MAG: hypothetical protein VW600_16505 [Ferrovibrio sp.]
MFRRAATIITAALALAATAVPAPAQAGSYLVAPGATARIDVADRNGYTTITVLNRSAAPGRLQLPAGGAEVAVPANGKAEAYDRYSRSPAGSAYISVTNTGDVPLQVISQYTVTVQLP